MVAVEERAAVAVVGWGGLGAAGRKAERMGRVKRGGSHDLVPYR